MKQIILISSRSPEAKNILNGDATYLVRKYALKEGDEVHIYVTKKKPPYLVDYGSIGMPDYCLNGTPNGDNSEVNGKVVAKFIVGKVEVISYIVLEDNYEEVDGESILLERGGKGYFVCENDLKPMCISYEELLKYGKEKPVYAHEITHLEIFDRPRKLGEYKKKVKVYEYDDGSYWISHRSITHAPQSWQYAWVEE